MQSQEAEAFNSAKQRVSIASETQLPGESACMIVDEWRKIFPQIVHDHDAYAVLEVLIEQVIVAHRLRYSETQAFRLGLLGRTAFVSKRMFNQAKLLCEISSMWLEVEKNNTHDRLYEVVLELLGNINGMPIRGTSSVGICIWQRIFKVILPYSELFTLKELVVESTEVHIDMAKSGNINMAINAYKAFARRAMVFRLKLPQVSKSRDELQKLEWLWNKITS